MNSQRTQSIRADRPALVTAVAYGSAVLSCTPHTSYCTAHNGAASPVSAAFAATQVTAAEHGTDYGASSAARTTVATAPYSAAARRAEEEAHPHPAPLQTSATYVVVVEVEVASAVVAVAVTAVAASGTVRTAAASDTHYTAPC